MISNIRIFLICGILLYFIFIFNFLKSKSLSLKYSLLWIISGIVMLVFALFPYLLDIVSSFIGIYTPANTLFAVGMLFLMLILMSITSIVSKQTDRITKLIQINAILEKRVRELEEK